MNQYLKAIQDVLKENNQLTEQEKETLLKAIADANKQWDIIDFKLDRTEKVKRTTTILLEETIAELENKRKAIEEQNRELEIEASLEKVRTVAMGMRKRDDMLDICRIISGQLELLGIKVIRNVQTAIFYEHKGTYINYEYYRLHDKALVTEVDYTKDEISVEFAAEMIKGADEVFVRSLEGQQVKDWLNFQKTTNVFIDTNLENAGSLTYYWFSLGPVAIGTSTYNPLNEEEISLFKRFRNVFDLAYRRYLDIEKAEAQAREAQIEAALERVRSQSMAMRTSEELKNVVKELRKQIGLLGQQELDTCVIQLYDESPDYIHSLASMKPTESNEEILDFDRPIPKKGLLIHEEALQAYSSGRKDYILLNEKRKLEQWIGFLKETYPDIYSVFIRSYGAKPEHVPSFWSFSDFNGGSLLMVTLTPPTDVPRALLRRFANVFGQAYRRYVDIKQAEAQARESQIQLAMERVRARTMAMHKSDELADVAELLFNQVNDLGIKTWTTGFNVWSEDNNFYTDYITNPQGGFMPPYTIDASKLPVSIEVSNAKKRGDEFLVNYEEGESLAATYRQLSKFGEEQFTSIQESGFEFPSHQYEHFVFGAKVSLMFITYDAVPEAHDIFKRFGKVFEQTYTRFLDLQKAEAQAKESQIQLALERVRARTMAMQHSDELKDAAALLFQQVKSLGVPAYSCGYNIWEKDEKEFTSWMSTQDGSIINGVPNIPLTQDANFIRYVESKQNGEPFFVLELRGERMQEHYEYLKTIPAFKGYFDYAVSVGFDLPKTQIHHIANFSQGNLLFITLEPCPEFHDVFRRFAAVFEQTYTRFLDLQKAEEQAREAKIEAALEKVRSRSLAMHKSDELESVVTIVFEKLRELNVVFDGGVGIYIFSEGSKNSIIWVASPDHFSSASRLNLPYQEDNFVNNPISSDIWTAREKGIDFYIRGYSFEEKNIYFKYLFEHNNYDQLPAHVRDWLLATESYTHSVALVKNSAIVVNSWTGQLLSENENEILRRFSRVFEQAYVRFLDLQKAEAQAREAKIEVALERTRTQSMLMQHSKELDDVLRIFHEQVLLLGIHSAFSFLWLPDEEKDRHIFWAAWAENNSKDFKSKAINYPLDRNEPATAQCLVDWKSDQPVVSYHVLPGGVESYFAAWQELIAGVEELRPGNFSDGLYYVEAFMKYGCFGVMVKNSLSWDEKKILGRFAIEFERTYTRFLDLQKAEAQAREAQIEAAMEKVRSRALAMQKPNELIEVAELLRKEMSLLGVEELETSSIYIHHEETGKTECWYAIKDVKYPEKKLVSDYMTIDLNETSVGRQMHEFYRSGAKQVSIVMHGDNRKEWINYCSEHSKVLEGFYGETIPDRTYHLYKFSNGYMGAASPGSISAESWDLLKRATNVFSLAYTRFSDLQQAEAQAREAQIEAALERVRSAAMAMHKSEELKEVANEMRKQLGLLGQNELETCAIHLYDESPDYFQSWAALLSPNEQGKVVQIQSQFPKRGVKIIEEMLECYARHKQDYVLINDGTKAQEFLEMIKQKAPEAFEVVEKSMKEQAPEDKRAYWSVADFAGGSLVMTTRIEPGENSRALLRRFANVFGLAYRRFVDLKKAEAQAKEAQIETALERVRSRTLAMQKSDELAETAAVLFKQLILLGIEPNRLYINIIKDETGEAEFWITDEDGSKISMAYTSNMNANPSFKKMYDGWKMQNRSLVIDMKGKQLEEYFKHLSSLNVPFKGGLSQKRRLQYIAYFNKGFIGMASPDEQPEETMQLLERFAAVFNLTFTRFNDLKIAEAHALQAEQDLVEIKAAKKKAEDTLTELQATQKQLVQSEKMASLGELTAGIAHEIQNPLNFVNNFSDVSNELLEEMKIELEKGNTKEVITIVDDVKQNLEKILHHGKRADAIVKGMLQHSRTSSSQKELTDINALADEYLRLAYHGLRAKDKSFNANFETDLDKSVGKINIVPQDIGRAVLNLITNAFYVVAEKKKQLPEGYEPTVTVTTKKEGNKVFVSVKDNGKGIPQKVLEKIFQPFFTTKPTGQGTGLGLSLAYDIIKAHGGEIKVETKEGEGSEFIIELTIV